jgi:hypothetical protein
MTRFFEALSDKRYEIVIATMGVYLCGCGSDPESRKAFTERMNAIKASNTKIVVASSCCGDSYDTIPGDALRSMGKYFCTPGAALEGIPRFVTQWNEERSVSEIVINPECSISGITLHTFLDNVAKYNSQHKIEHIVRSGHSEIENVLRGNK